jgi:hypothetical protein
MPAFLLSVPANQSYGNRNRDVVVFAEDEANAIEFAKAAYNAGTDAVWDNATATELVDADDFLGWSIRVTISTADDLATDVDVTHVGIALDAVDDVGDALVILINANADIGAAAYDGLTNILTCAAIGDNIGEAIVTMTWTPPGVNRQAIPSYTGAITDGGVQAAALTIQLNTDAVAIGAIIAELPRQE